MPDLSTITPVTREEEFLDRIARAAASPNLPEVDASDNGDVLTVVSGEWAAAAPAGGLPEVTSTDEGKVLTVVDNSGTYEWEAAEPAASGGGLCVIVADSSADSCLYLNKTYTEIIDAFSEYNIVQFVGPIPSSAVLAAFTGFAFCAAAWSPILEKYIVTLNDLGDTYWEDLFPDDNGRIVFSSDSATGRLEAAYTSL